MDCSGGCPVGGPSCVQVARILRITVEPSTRKSRPLSSKRGVRRGCVAHVREPRPQGLLESYPGLPRAKPPQHRSGPIHELRGSSPPSANQERQDSDPCCVPVRWSPQSCKYSIRSSCCFGICEPDAVKQQTTPRQHLPDDEAHPTGCSRLQRHPRPPQVS